MATNNLELELLEVSQAIGKIADSNCHYTAGLAVKLATLNKPLQALTVGELLVINSEYNAEFNQIHHIS